MKGKSIDKNTAMEKLARDACERGCFTRTWLYAEKGEIVSKGAVGFRDTADTLPVEEDTIFQLASVTKQFTAAAVMLLVRKGMLRLEDEITDLFPELGAYKGVTIRHLLTHTGGVPDYFEDEDWFIKIWKEEKRVPGSGEILNFLCETELKPPFTPRRKVRILQHRLQSARRDGGAALRRAL
ncbi:MAG: beta-lactamase family protein [Clostridia bacterium]|nr:beta-lactamase family protein [Clostridia bacterium]